MRISLRGFGLFLISFITGTLCALVVGLLGGPLRAPLYSWPTWIALFWFVFWKYKVLRYVGFIWVLPLSLLGFEMLWSNQGPPDLEYTSEVGVYADPAQSTYWLYRLMEATGLCTF